MVTAVFPDSSNAHDSWGEVYVKAGNEPRAIAENEAELLTLGADHRVPESALAQRRKNAQAQLKIFRSQRQ